MRTANSIDRLPSSGAIGAGRGGRRMLLMIDNYDSFTFNLVQYFGGLGEDVRVVRNDEIDVAGIAALRPDRLVLSPGPCTPAEAGVCIAAIDAFTGKLPILGVCLGHQAIGAALGGKVVRAQRLMHGKADTLSHDGRGVFVAARSRWRTAMISPSLDVALTSSAAGRLERSSASEW